MSKFSELLPRKKNKGGVFTHRNDPLHAFNRQMGRIFDDFFGDFHQGWSMTPSREDFSTLERTLSPSMDISENENEYLISAELPGMDEKDLDISLHENVLRIRGEKKADKEEKKKDYHLIERSYGRIERSIPLPEDIDQNRVSASFKKGVLEISIPKTEISKREAQKIQIQVE